MDDDKKVVDPTTSMLSEFAKLIQEGKKAKEEAEAKKKQTFFEKYKIENTELNPFSFISELAKLKHEAETPQEEIIEQPEMVAEEVLPEPVAEVKKQSASELLAELASLIQQGKSANKEVFEENQEQLEPFVAEMVQEIVELQQEEVKEEPKPVDLISRTVESITKVEQSKVNEVTNLFSTTESDKTSPNFKAIQSKLKSLEQWVGKISTAGAGSGSYWLNDLGDTDKNSLQNATDGQVLTFSTDIGKWTAQDATGGGGGNIDTTARTLASSASANTVIIQGVDFTQNTNITAADSKAQAAFDKANTIVSDTQIDPFARTQANSAFNKANSATVLAQAAFDKANTTPTSLSSQNYVYVVANTSGTLKTWEFTPSGSINFPDFTTQTTAFTGTGIDSISRNIGQGAFDFANTSNIKIDSAYAFANSVNIKVDSVYAWSNTINIKTDAAFSKANDANIHANAAYNLANIAITTSGGSITGRLNVSYTPATTIGTALTISSANTQGGTSYADFLKVTNTSAGATNPNKTFRLNGDGGLEIVNSDYSATILQLNNSGTLSVGSYNVNGKQAVNGPSFSAYPTSPAQTITNATGTRVNFGNEEYDIGGCYDAPNGKFQPNVEGYYQLNATVRIDGSSGTGERMIVIFKNGSEYKRGTNEAGTESGASFFSMSVSCQAYANGSSDYFEVYVVQNSGVNRTVSMYQQISYFQGCMLRGA